MSTNQNRLTLTIDVFEKAKQKALALPSLTPPELVEAILGEFGRDLEYMSESADDYQLVRAADSAPLQDDLALGAQQVRDGESLALVERGGLQPPGTSVPSRSRHIYLRDTAGGKLYKLPWLPAIIGRPDEKKTHNSLLAVDLSVYATGLRVSRRHAQIVEESGQYVVESLARNNPTIVLRDGQGPVTLDGQRYQLRHGDTIRLQHSELSFKFIIREGR
jgi:hypothetical protein